MGPVGDVAHLAGLVAFARGQVPRALELLEQAGASGLDSADFHANRAHCLVAAGRVFDSLDATRKALAHDPSSARAFGAAAFAHLELGAVPEAVAHLRTALSLGPDLALHSTLLQALALVPGSTEATLAAERAAFEQALPAGEGVSDFDRAPDRRLRIGYLVSQAHAATLAMGVAPLAAAHRRKSFEVHALVTAHGGAVAEVAAACDEATDLSAASPEEAAGVVRGLGIDVLVDAIGHGPDNQARLLAQRPAPLQIAWLGAPSAWGRGVQHVFSDEHLDPVPKPGALVLPSGALCFAPIEGAPPVGPAPCESAGHITFGAVQPLSRVSPDAVALWARALRIVPGSRLVVEAPSLADAKVRAHLSARFAAHKIEASRLTLRPRGGDRFGRWDDIDIALDTTPCDGASFLFEALWMGVPVLGLEGDRRDGRWTTSLLRRASLGTAVAASPADLIDLVAEWAGDRAELARLRASLRDTVAGSAACDVTAMAEDVERLVRAAWRARVAARG